MATPGAGKTTFALRIATELLDRGVIRAVTVVAPTEHLKHQWADAAAGSASSSTRRSPTPAARSRTSTTASRSPTRRSPPSRCCTAAAPQETPTLVILDEIHHGGDALSWGDGIREAFEPATRRLALTGTPFRSDTTPIPFVRYEMGEDGIRRSAPTTPTGTPRRCATASCAR